MEEEAYPALDELTSKISTLNLERVRQIKSRLVALSGRVQKVDNMLLDDGSYQNILFFLPLCEVCYHKLVKLDSFYWMSSFYPVH